MIRPGVEPRPPSEAQSTRNFYPISHTAVTLAFKVAVKHETVAVEGFIKVKASFCV